MAKVMTRKELMNYIKTCKTKKDFGSNKRAAYAAEKLGLSRMVLTKKLERTNTMTKWDADNILKQAGKYKSTTEWYKKHKSSYNAAIRNFGTVSIFTNILGFKTNTPDFTKNDVLKKAIKYRSLKEFYLNSPNHYKHAIRNNYIDKVKKIWS